MLYDELDIEPLLRALRQWTPQQAMTFLDLLEHLTRIIWQLHEADLVPLVIRQAELDHWLSMDDGRDDPVDDPDDTPIPF